MTDRRSSDQKAPSARPLAAVVSYTLRSCLPTHRALLALPTLVTVLFGLLSRTAGGAAAYDFAEVAGIATHTLVLPIASLVIGDAVLGAEVRSGTFAFTWLSPVPYPTIVAGRWLGGWLIALGALVPAATLGAVAAGTSASIGPAVIAIGAGSAAYLAIFLVVGATFKRPVVWSLALVVLVERLLGAALAGVAQLSPGWLGQAVLVGLTPGTHSLRRAGIPHGWAAVGRLALITAVALVVASRRLRHLRPATATD